VRLSSLVSALRRCLDGASCQLQDLLPHGELQRFQIELFDRPTTEKLLNFRNDVAGQ
jgi:hypothetical protein